MVNIHGNLRVYSSRLVGRKELVRPADPKSLLEAGQVQEQAEKLVEWWTGKKSVLCITGAGLSTESGIPDYRGHQGSYHKGHKPMIHQQFMDSEYQRRRYWGRSLAGWKTFDSTQPNKGHFALAALERMGRIGVALEDQEAFYEPADAFEFGFTSGQRQLAVVTQNVDALHQKAGSKEVMQLHGAGNLIRCMNCGTKQHRNEYHSKLLSVNQEWLNEALKGYEQSSDLRPDGDAKIKEDNYDDVDVPNCHHCDEGFFKPDVVFFGDSVPKSRVRLFEEAVKAADGLLVVGTSLAVHSAYRHVRAANSLGISTAIVNVGETRAEAEGLENILKIEAPAGDTLSFCVEAFENESNAMNSSVAQ
ncbi:unnamed protein product [Cylindrotheca closterium]|uniref:Deacetylase sirtuin-type domain-containing protein n=1 Tax=Cylindrotheca closterium TaxID=2856 RepID=A0AAD2JNF2_9STRA|nr:unnamed protein product [Cylindrotheca closterium]